MIQIMNLMQADFGFRSNYMKITLEMTHGEKLYALE